MSFIDNTYFIRDISLTGSAQLDNITSWITDYEPEILTKLLGYDLYTELVADLDVDGNPQTQKFTNFVDGKAFSVEFNGHTISTKWIGLRNTLKKSLISYYVYFQYKIENESFDTSLGQMVANAENSTRVDATPAVISSWNKMINLYGFTPFNYIDRCFLDNSAYIHYNILPSAYNYLLANISDFSNWVFEPLETHNIFGI